MYIPERFRAEETPHLLEVIHQNPFGTLITAGSEGLVATHVPFLLKQSAEGEISLQAHFARANPHWESLLQATEILVVFQGGDAYISPGWYDQHPSVPTWNYVAVHAYGTAKPIEGAVFRELLEEQIQFFEQGLPDAWEPNFTEEYWERMMRGIVGVAIHVNRLEGKFKLSQNRSNDEQSRVRGILQNQPEPTRAQQIASWMKRREKDSENEQ